MRVRKIRNQDKVGKIILDKFEVEACRKNGIDLHVYVKQMLAPIAKKRRWKWYFTKEQT